MPGIKSNLIDLIKSFEKFKEKTQKERDAITDLRREFVQRGYSPWMATQLAQEQYKNSQK